ncbi:arsenite methyltransferase [Lampris incognitus]|uniref:arsenite methyltransferase n=1 Tax=Lampris incognitus TaxID=2546036 RepID=UPI0024B49A65|nr:arsenite methyltransferase [Lampris incognitus]XP_056139941.1 arsenite methyltransferase [Lampris incognitus]XP_056139942.1 arsenite methyltransferase [Lampris incognitus]
MAGCVPVPSEEPSTTSNPVSSNVHENVKKYYGRYLESSEGLQTSAASCSFPCRPTPKSVVDALTLVHPEVTQRFFGCGLPVPEKVESCKILDLGSGSGRDCFALSKLVGEEGHVTGIDMTKELIDVSCKYIEYHQKKFGYIKPNTTFVHGYMEKLSEAGIQNDSMDIVVSNCVICLCPDKRAVLQEAHNVLKEGGEVYLSDMYASKVIPDRFKQDPILWGEGMGGSLFWPDFIALAQEVGFSTPCLVSASHIVIHNCELKAKTGDISYASGTYRLFKIPKTRVMSKAAVTYKGTVADFPDEIEFDSSHIFKRDVAVEVDWEMAAFLRCSRFSPDFSIQILDKPQPSPSSTAQYCHLNPFLLADKRGSSVRQCSKTDRSGGCST